MVRHGGHGGGGDLNIDPAGLRALLHSPGIRQMLKERGDSVATAVRGHPSVSRNQVLVVVREGDPNRGTRARVWVRMNHPAALRIEAKYRALGSAVDAARR